MAGEADTEYRVLARKYRPSSFDDLIGQQPMVQTLSNAFASNRVAQAYMLTGVRGVGKTTTARILARALNYESDTVQQPTLDISTEGVHCPDIMEGNHVDVIEMDAASHTGINDIREIIASVRYKPVSARYKVYIIDEVHMLSNQAFNGLLKTLEEPPEHVKFIFATTEIRKVPITVLSRCQRFDLRRIEAGELMELLAKIAKAEGIETEDEALAMLARAGEGSVRDALSLLDQGIAHSAGSGGGMVTAEAIRNMLGLADRARVIDLFEHIMKGDISAALDEIKSQYDVGADPAAVLTDLAEFVHFVTKVRYVDSALNDPSLSETEKMRGKEFADKLSPRILGRTWQMLLKGIVEVQTSSRPLAAADMVLVRLTHAADLPAPEDVIKSLETGGTTTTPSPTSGGSESKGSSAATTSNSSTSSSPPTGSEMTIKQVANGPTLVIDNGSEPEQELAPPVMKIVPDAVVEPAFESISSLRDLLNVSESRDKDLKLMLRNNFSEIAFEQGHIEFSLIGKPHKDLVSLLRSRLREWTGEAWNVVVSRDEGKATIKEAETAEREQHFSDAEEDPVVAAVLKTFPKARILDVRFPGNESEDGLDVAAALEAGLENPDQDDDADDENPTNNSSDPGAGGLDDYFN